jgi:tetratricopeptide (TPR) repeat protein
VRGPGDQAGWRGDPDESVAIETSQIRGPDEKFNPNFVMVPTEPRGTPRGPSRAEGSEPGGRGGEKDDKDRAEDGGHGRSGQAPSLTRMLIYCGVMALVCGLVGAWAYSSFFGSGKSGDHKSSGKDTKSDKDSGPDKGSQPGANSEPGKSTDASKKDSGKLLQAQAAWVEAVKELRDAREGEKTARRSEEDAKAVLQFIKRKLLAPGRSADGSLADTFWAGGPGKDVSLRKAVDLAEAKVAESFADRPMAEAYTREMLGLAYLNLGEPSQAVGEYERALALREAMQRANDPETAECRNQLAVAYRLAGRAGEGGRLFDRSPDSASRADALAVRGATLLLQKQPEEAALKLRECLTIREKLQPDDWRTFDAKSVLGEALLDQHKFAEAEPLLVSGYEGMNQRRDKVPPEGREHVTKALERLVKLYEAWGKNDELMKWRIELETWQSAQKRRGSAS